MSTDHTTTGFLELSSLAQRHEYGLGLLLGFGPHLVVRLSLDPTCLPPEISHRDVAVNWLPKGAKSATQLQRTIQWGEVEQAVLEGCDDMVFTVPEKQLTENAAIAMFSLLISDLEEGEICTLAPLGSRGDYWVNLAGEPHPILGEVSGIKQDGSGHDSVARLGEKTIQVLSGTKTKVGFVSVTAFSHGANGVVHSYLHFVKKSRPKMKKPGDRKGNK